MTSEKKLKVLFVCHGNICRSPMAEFIFRRMVSRAGLDGQIEVDSAAVSDEEEGNPVYPLAKRILAVHGIGCRDKVAHQITQKMYDDSDYVIVMEQSNVLLLERVVSCNGEGKVSRLLDFVKNGDENFKRDIADPWYTRDFETAWNDISLGCNALLEFLKTKVENQALDLN